MWYYEPMWCKRHSCRPNPKYEINSIIIFEEKNTPGLRGLHWLSVRERALFQALWLVHSCKWRRTSDRYMPTRYLRSSGKRLRREDNMQVKRCEFRMISSRPLELSVSVEEASGEAAVRVYWKHYILTKFITATITIFIIIYVLTTTNKFWYISGECLYDLKPCVIQLCSTLCY